MRGWGLALWLAAVPAWPQSPVVVGAALPETGQLAARAAPMKQALELWREGVNAAGGLLGRPVELRILDDRSEASAAMHLYERLIETEGADLLLGPFGSAAVVGAAATAERKRRILVNATGVTQSAQRAGRRYVFHVVAPLSDYGAGPLAVARAAGHARLHIVARSDPVSREAAAALAADAAAAGLQAVLQPTAPGTRDYRAQIAAARQRNAEAWIGFGVAEDAAGMVKSFKRIGYAPWMFLAQGAAEPDFLHQVGQDAEHALGLSTYEPNFAGAANAAFVAAWRKRWPGEPDATAAHAYAAGLVLAAAVRTAGSLEGEALRAALSSLEVQTPLGPYRDLKPAVIQIQSGRREVVWPPSLATAKWRLPYPRWDERRVHAPQ
jgi:branched-chain amino acid transport system substrate-binding protein